MVSGTGHNSVAALFVLCLSACLTKRNTVTEEFSNGGLPFTLVYIPGNTRMTIRIAWPSNWANESANDSADIKERNQAVPYIGTELLFAGIKLNLAGFGRSTMALTLGFS